MRQKNPVISMVRFWFVILDFRVVPSNVAPLNHSDIATALDFWRFSAYGAAAPSLVEQPNMVEQSNRSRHAGFDQQAVPMRGGGCLCGAVRFSVGGEPLVVGTCHCTDCRKATGAAFVIYADWPRAAFTSAGQIQVFKGRSFCPACGSRVFHLSEAIVEVMIGALDDAPGDLRPTREGWTIRREHWLAPVADATQFAKDPAPSDAGDGQNHLHDR
jgi:hypothetical protein